MAESNSSDRNVSPVSRPALGLHEAPSDGLIQRALARTSICPEFVSWYGQRNVTVRVQVDGCHEYAEFTVTPFWDEDRVVDSFERASRQLAEARDV